MTIKMEFYVPGQPFDGGEYHYVESGLDNVYLKNGFFTEDDPDYGRLVTFENVDGLHRAIALRLITEGRPLTSREFKFIRRLTRLTQTQVADVFGVDVQTVANYEKGNTQIPKTADEVFKAGYLLSILPKNVHARVVAEMVRPNNKKPSKDTVKQRECLFIDWRESKNGCGAAGAC